MKKKLVKPAISILSLFALCFVIFSFTPKTGNKSFNSKTDFGGEGFEIFLNDKLIVQQYGEKMKDIKTVQLDQSVTTGQLAVRYYHCGQPGKARVIRIKDEKNMVIREWKFGDAKDASAKICCNVKDILALPKLKTGKKVNLYYSSAQTPDGRLLVTLIGGTKSAVVEP